MGEQSFENFLVIAILILSTALHEMAHAYTATWLGDPTPGRFGRLTLNPFPHLQPVLTAIILPFVMYMSGNGLIILAQTPIDPSRFKHPLRDQALVAIAGPLTNVLCALLLIGALWIPGVWETDGPPTIRMIALDKAAFYNFILAIFNMLPFPPLDGYRIIRAVLPIRLRMAADGFSRHTYSLILCMIVGSRLIRYFVPFVEVLMDLLVPAS